MSSFLPLVDLVLRNGRIATFAAPDQGPAQVQSIAIAGGRVVATGDDADLAWMHEHATRVIDLEGRRVIPGLNDSHIHAVRGGVSWNRIVHWEDVRSLAQGLDRMRRDDADRPEGQWTAVVGGWHSSQLAERRPPTRAELDEAVPERPAYVQEGYDRAVLNSAGLLACGWTDESADPPRGELLRDDRGRLTGEVRGVGAFAVPLAAALLVDSPESEAGILAMGAEFARHGLTGVVDGGGLLVTPRDYDPLYALWRRGELPLRFRTFISAWNRGGEVADIDGLTTLVPAGAGDGMLRIAGVGEIPHLGCHDLEGFDRRELDESAVQELTEITRLCVRRGWRMSIHAVLDSTLSRILDAWEAVEAETGLVAGAGFSIVHADEASPRSLERIARLGAGVLVQNRFMLKGADYAAAWGDEQAAQAPPTADMKALGIIIGGGTDATRANWFSPWASIWWLVTGATLDGAGAHHARHLFSREDALAAFTRDAAWFTGEQSHRGRLVPGYDADLCVPSSDPFECDDDELRDIMSDLTIMGGRITHEKEQQ